MCSRDLTTVLAALLVGILGAPGLYADELAGDGIQPGFTLVDGDILVPIENVSGAYAARLWPGGVVPYLFGSSVSSSDRQRAVEAMAEWEAVAGVRFRPRISEPNYLQIVDSSGNSAAVGMVGGFQPVNIHNWDRRFVIVHELGHALGLWHEQSRLDRESACSGSPCIIIEAQNISQTACDGRPCNFNFELRPTFGVDLGPYDFDSVMHYSQCAFSKNPSCPDGGGETIIVPPPNESWQSSIGQRTHLSSGDKAAMDFLYPNERTCPGRITATSPLQNAIDARQPLEPNGGGAAGWDRIRFEFEGDPGTLRVSDLAIGSTLGAPPLISGLLADGNSLTLTLDRPIRPGGLTTVIIKPCQFGVQLGYLPADVNGNGTSSPADLLALIDCLNGESCPDIFATDIDRSGVNTPADILKEVDLLNGGWSGRSLPTQPDAWIADVRAPLGLIGIPAPGEYQVTVCRNAEGPATLIVPLGVTVGDPPVTYNTLETAVLDRSTCQTKTIFVPTPAVHFSCSETYTFEVRACANLAVDVNSDNNCKTSLVEIAPAFFDLDYTVLADTDQTCINEQVCWNVQVCNHGTVTSTFMNSRTGICPDKGDDYSPCVGGGPYFFTVPPIDSGECWTPPQKFCVTPTAGAFRNQFIKTGTNPYPADVCLAKNQDDKPITVGYPDLVVRNVTSPDAVCGTQWFDGGFDLCNEGDCDAYGTFTVGGWISLDGNPFDGHNDIGVGTKVITLSPALVTGECRHFSFRSLSLPPNPYLTTQKFVVCADIGGGAPCNSICEGNEFNNCGSANVSVVPLDVAVIDVTAPSNVFGCVGPRTYSTKVRNNSACDVHGLPVRTCVGTFSSVTCGNFTFQPCVTSNIATLGGSETVELLPSILTPPVFGGCGQRIPFTLSALLLNWGDSNNPNNYRGETMYITVPCSGVSGGQDENSLELPTEELEDPIDPNLD